MDTETWRFQWACISGAEPKTPFFAVEDIVAADAGRPNALFSVYFGNNWHSYTLTPDWSPVAISAAKDPADLGWVVVAISASGRTWELRPKERLERLSRIQCQADFTNLATVGDAIYACGMGRVVVQRLSHGDWADISAPRPTLDEGVVGFTALAGLSASLIYAVGWKGEVWTRSASGWSQEDIPSNANLNALAITSQGTVYAVGDEGVMIRGQRGRWEVVETNTDFNLLDVCVHEGAVYACTDFEVLRLGDTGLVAEFDDGSEDVPGTCLKLVSAGAGGLYSVGPYDVLVRLDASWRRLA
jgi:hypothetical protein